VAKAAKSQAIKDVFEKLGLQGGIDGPVPLPDADGLGPGVEVGEGIIGGCTVHEGDELLEFPVEVCLARSASAFRSRRFKVIFFLFLALTFHRRLNPFLLGPVRRIASPSGGSTLITSAP
jgi:hypothetical protein